MRHRSRSGWPVVAAVFVTLLLSACGGEEGPAGPSTRALEIAEARELGTVGKPGTVTARDGGATGLIGGRLLWLFGDTLFNPRSVDGTNLRTCTAALADAASPLSTTEPVDANGAPFACLPFDEEEAAFNRTSGRPDLRVALWPGSVVPDGGGGLVYYIKLIVNPGFLNYDLLGVGIARVATGATSAVRERGLLFTAPEPTFHCAMAAGGNVYAYGLRAGTQEVAVAMAPQARATDRGAYRYWDGATWSSDARRASALFGGVSGALTVSYNAYLGRYLAVSSEALSNRVLMRVADRPEGPWGPPVLAFTGMSTTGSTNYAAREHPELAQDGGRRVFVTYYQPMGGFRGELRLVEVAFR